MKSMNSRFSSIIFLSFMGLTVSMSVRSEDIQEIKIDDEDRTERIKIPQVPTHEPNRNESLPPQVDSPPKDRIVRIVIDVPTPCADIQTIKDVNRDAACLQIQDSGALELKRTSPSFIFFEKQGFRFTVTCLSQSRPSQRIVYQYSQNEDGKLSQFTTPDRKLTFDYKDGKCFGRIGSGSRPSVTSTPATILIPTNPDGAVR